MEVKHIFLTLVDGHGGDYKFNLSFMDFDKLNWHDSVILDININRSKPGINDTINLNIEWYDGKIVTIAFKGVYWAEFNMNFGIVCSETVKHAFSEGKENIIVKDLCKKWKGNLDTVDLNYYEIETNSTKSKIRIIAKSYLLSKPS